MAASSSPAVAPTVLIPKKNTTSEAWKHFGLKAGPDGKPLDTSTAYCTLCQHPVSAKGGNTSNLFSHLKFKHPKEFSDIEKTRKSQHSMAEKKVSNNQPKIAESIKSSQKYSRSSKQWEKLTNSVTYAIAKDMLPLSTVEKPGFQNMLSTFDNRYQLPNRKYMSNTAIPSLYLSVKDKVADELKEMVFFSGTTDLWSSRGMVPYLGFTIHFIDNAWNLKSRVLQTVFMPEDHTADHLAQAFESTLETWDLKKEQMVVITTDNGANIVKAVKTNLGWGHMSCFGHSLNLAVTNAIKDDARLSRALGVCRKIVSSFSSSWKKKRDLKATQIEKDLPQHSLVAVSIINK